MKVAFQGVRGAYSELAAVGISRDKISNFFRKNSLVRF